MRDEGDKRGQESRWGRIECDAKFTTEGDWERANINDYQTWWMMHDESNIRFAPATFWGRGFCVVLFPCCTCVLETCKTLGIRE